jgi:hypothetical protein
MSRLTNRSSQQTSLSQLKPHSALWIAVLCFTFALLFNGCSWWSSTSSSTDDTAILTRERARLEAEKRAEREAVIRELLARNVPANTDSDKLWDGFRQVYPYHSQALALSVPSADGSRTLIVSEPPPNLSAGDILFPLGSLLRNHSEKRQKIGYDGWVKDVVVEIAGSKPEIDSAISSLNQLLFNTSYKSYVLPLPAKASSKAPFNLDLQVTSAELKRWALDDKETFTPVEGGESFSLQQLFEQKVSGVFYGDRGALVAWFIPKGRTVDDCRVQTRQFSLDSDLIVGAFSNPRGIIVLGRDRVIPVDLLPPLRVETLSLLGAVQQGQSGQLKQSYERNHLFAGRIEGSKDWAPILLSPELRDTEYGSLLNITDQLLKGWSNNGETSYYNFKYPRPKKWPFKGSLVEMLDTSELTYNWNTRGAGYTVDVGDYRLLALNRTGALPVSYFPVEGGRQESPTTLSAEEDAYNYFAKLNDPNLVRVVQYAAMYQIFSAFDIAKPSNSPPSSTLADQKLEEITGELLAEIRNASPQKLEELTRQLTPLVSTQLQGKDLFQLLLAERMKDYSAQIPQLLQDKGYVRGTPLYDFAFEQLMSSARENARGEVKEYLSEEKKKLDGEVRSQLKMVADGEDAGDEEAALVRKTTLSQMAGLRKLPERYAEAAGSQSDGWIHTPSVVISWNNGSLLGAIGGHNLDAKVTQFRISDEVAAGVTRVDSEGNILVNSRDFDRVNGIVRTAGRAEGGSTYELSSELNSALKTVSQAPPRSEVAALSLPASPPLPPNGPPRVPLSFAEPGPEFGGDPWHAGWARARSQLTEPEPLQAILRQRRAEVSDIILIERDPDGLISIANSEKSPTIKATTSEDAVDVVVQLMRRAPDEAQALNIEFRGFQQQEAQGFIKSCEVRASSEKIPREISGVVDEAGGGGGGSGTGKGSGRNGGPDEPGSGGPGNGGSGDDGTGRNNFDGGDNERFPLGMRGRKFDFSKAEVRVNPEVVVKNGLQHSSISVEVPTADAGPAGRSTIELGFRQSTPREVVNAATQRVANSVRNFVRGIRNQFQALSFNLKLNSEIKSVSGEMDIDIKLIRHSFDSGKGDLYFVKKEERDEPPASDTTACQTA